MPRPKVSWGQAVSTSRGGSAQSLLAKAILPLGRVVMGTRVILDDVEHEVVAMTRKEGGGYTIECAPVPTSTRKKRGSR